MTLMFRFFALRTIARQCCFGIELRAFQLLTTGKGTAHASATRRVPPSRSMS